MRDNYWGEGLSAGPKSPNPREYGPKPREYGAESGRRKQRATVPSGGRFGQEFQDQIGKNGRNVGVVLAWFYEKGERKKSAGKQTRNEKQETASKQ